MVQILASLVPQSIINKFEAYPHDGDQAFTSIMTGAVFGVGAALLIGLSDLFGRRITLRTSAITTSSSIQGFSAAAILLSLFLWPGTFSARDVTLGALSGGGFALGLCSYHLGLTKSSAAVIAPLTAVLSALIPFGWVLIRGIQLSPLSAMGAGLALLGLAAATTSSPLDALSKAGIQLGLLAGVGYGLGQAVLLEVAASAGPVAIAGQRLAAFGFMIPLAVMTNNRVVAPKGATGWGISAGVCAGGASIALFHGLRYDPVAAVIGISLFPLFSAVIGRVAYQDTLTKRHALGIACAVIGTIGVIVG